MRVRVRFAKRGKVRFTSHRDVARMWERALRRARLPVARTEGFHPRPKLSFGLALSTGHESLAEYLDIELAEPLEPAEIGSLAGRLTPELPAGVDALAAQPLAPGSRSLQEAVGSCSWEIEAWGLTRPEIDERLSRALAAERLVVTRTRKGREVVDDLRPAVLAAAVVDTVPGGARLQAELAVHPRSVRPGELLGAIDPVLEEGRVRRTAQWIWHDDAREEPLPLVDALGVPSPTPADASTTRRDHHHDRARSRSAGVDHGG
ncbi:MAG TPA: TIGR03936 family radical SAM-associated protein, partial [Acidimicrobiales bacterium]|nr:TIGR03936 family radical SAM-associated protein [Acidimicrobiales bacterium]